MPISLILTKRGKSLIAEESMSLEHLAKFAEGDQIKCTITRPRNIGHHRKFFLLLSVVMSCQENPPMFATTTDLLDCLKIALGHVRQVKCFNGDINYIPQSIDFASMDNEDFQQFYDRAVDLILANVLPNCSKRGLEESIFNILGISPPSEVRL